MATDTDTMPDGQVISQWHIRKGATFEKEYEWSTGPNEATQTPVDLTGWTVRAQVREKAESGNVILSVDNGLVGGVTATALGKISIEISATATAAVVPMKGVFDVELVSPGGKVKNFVGGPVIFYPEVTRM